MATKLKPQAKLFMIIGIPVMLFLVYSFAQNRGWVPAIGILKTVSIGRAQAQLPDIKDAVVANVEPLPFPSESPNGCDAPIRNEVWAWNAQFGWLYSNGGPSTTKGSIAEKLGACQTFNRQDDTTQMQADLLACAKELSKSTDCASGVNFISIMADGAGQFLAQFNALAQKECKDCTGEIVGSVGFSRGEDKLMGPEQWKASPRSALGDGLIAGVLRDGDWNTAQKWAADNGLKNNPDEKTFDKDALNWINADNYIKAAQMYVAGQCEDRKVIKDGHLTGETVNVCVKAIVTWTPGDVIAAKQKGGIVNVVSTKQYRSQMPVAIIGVKKWDHAHSDKIAAMLAAALLGGDQIKAFPKALKMGGDISARVYCQNNGCAGAEEQNGDYWAKYYKGVTEPDATGHPVELGGSYADGMNDALTAFGVTPGANNNVKATYTVFAKIVDAQYHPLFAKTPIPPYEQVASASYLLQAKGLVDNPGSAADVPQYSATSQPSQVVGDKNWDIEFATGSAMLTNSGIQTVQQIKDQVAITGLTVILNGYTDNTGSAIVNRELSERRAYAVKEALRRMAPADFPEARFRVKGYGPDRPIADNQSADGRARNRRVEVVLAD